MTTRAGLAFTKAHGAGNDFLVVDDHDGSDEHLFTPATVAALCHRRLGVGADGLLRVVRTAAAPGDVGPVLDRVTSEAAAGAAAVPEWFMDYRNADGSLARMCGNGVRVFVAHLRRHGLVPAAGAVDLLTRAGIRTVHDARSDLPTGWTTVAMGPVEVGATGIDAVGPVRAGAGAGPVDEGGLLIHLGTARWSAVAADVGNPHAVVVLSPAEFAALAPVGALGVPTADPAGLFVEGFNLELLTVRGPGELAVRIVERGVGETLACGTGVCAAVAVAATTGLLDAGRVADGVTVRVPGGALDVRLAGTGPRFGDAELSGPAEVVATGIARLD